MSAHARILSCAGKMANVHLVTVLHSLVVLVATVMTVFGVARWLLSQDPQQLLQLLATRSSEGLLNLQSLASLKWVLCAVLGPIPPAGMMMSATTYLIVKDTMEGKLSRDIAIAKKLGPTELAAPDVQGSVKGPDGMGWWQRLQLFCMITADNLNSGFVTLMIYGLVPETMAAWSLLRNKGMGFHYTVGAKPKDAS